MSKTHCKNLPYGAEGYAIHQYIQSFHTSFSKSPPKTLLILIPSQISSYAIYETLRFLQPTKNVLFFPNLETLPYDHFSASKDIIAQRLQCLNALIHLDIQQDNNITTIIISHAKNILKKLPPKHYIQQHIFQLKVGDTLILDNWKQQMLQAGFQITPLVEHTGQMRIQGGIIDIYPFGTKNKMALRIELFDTTVESLRYFDVKSQRSIQKIESIEIKEPF